MSDEAAGMAFLGKEFLLRSATEAEASDKAKQAQDLVMEYYHLGQMDAYLSVARVLTEVARSMREMEE